jgi:hypothetical protein
VTFVFYFFLWAGFITAIVLHRRDRKRNGVAGTGSESESDDAVLRSPALEGETEVVVENAKAGEQKGL